MTATLADYSAIQPLGMCSAPLNVTAPIHTTRYLTNKLEPSTYALHPFEALRRPREDYDVITFLLLFGMR